MINSKPITIKIKIDYEISLWQAIKLRIAGKAYQKVAEEIIAKIKHGTEKPETRTA